MNSTKETDLFPPVKQLFEKWGFDVYSEVQPGWGGKRADVVAVHWPVVAVIELKTRMSLELLDQALGWKGHANYVYIAVPKLKKRHRFVEQVLRQEGIGLIELRPEYRGWNDLLCRIPAKLHRRICLDWHTIIKDEHKNGPPGGSKSGGYITDYSLMMRNVRRILNYPGNGESGLTIKEILDQCETYYKQPKASLAHALLKYEKDWCKICVGDDGKRRYRAANQPEPAISMEKSLKKKGSHDGTRTEHQHS